jgi:putative addiction module component (TIGR02574 family)
MDRETAEILERAIRLPEEARAALADFLLESLDTEVDENSEEAWREEIQRRLGEIDTGAVRLVPWSEARKRLEARLKK